MNRLGDYKYYYETVNDYSFLPSHNGFVQMFSDSASTVKQTGWKFHLSVDPKDVPKAWQIFAEYAMTHKNIHVAKVAGPAVVEEFSDGSPDNGQLGKMITAYDSGTEPWGVILSDIEHLFTKNGIRPGYAVRDDKQVSGSRFTFYRFSGGPGKYIPAMDLEKLPREQRYYTGLNIPDKFAQLSVQPVGKMGETHHEAALPLYRKGRIPGIAHSRLMAFSPENSPVSFNPDIGQLRINHPRAKDHDLILKALSDAGISFGKGPDIRMLSAEDQSAIREKVETFDAFSEDCDPYGERDFGSFTHNGELIYWKIDCYDPSLTYGSEDPSDPHQTVRVLTILLASEY